MEKEVQNSVSRRGESCQTLQSHPVFDRRLPTRNNTHSHRSLFSNSRHIFFVALFVLCCLPLTSASAPVYIKEQILEPRKEVSNDGGLTLDRLAKSGQILVDLSPQPKGLEWTLATENDDLRRRQELGEDATFSVVSSAEKTSAKATPTVTVTKGASSSTTGTGIVAAGTEAASPLPSPFDSGFNSNITATCSSFMTGMLQNSTFKQCLPISILLQNSMSFFQAQKSVVRITQVLDASCSANVTTCGRAMAAFASNITSESACSGDIKMGNPIINQARLGLLAYKPLYTATCLKNQVSKSYCFAEAITNATNPSDNYLYYVPLNISLPGGSQPTCNSCLQNTMAVYSAATADRGSALASNYVNAAMQVNVNCGPTFTNASLASAVVANASPSPILGNNYGLIALVFAVGSLLL